LEHFARWFLQLNLELLTSLSGLTSTATGLRVEQKGTQTPIKREQAEDPGNLVQQKTAMSAKN